MLRILWVVLGFNSSEPSKKSLPVFSKSLIHISLLLAGVTFCFYHISMVVEWLHNTKHFKLKQSKMDQRALSNLISVITLQLQFKVESFQSKLELKPLCSCFTMSKTSFPVFIICNSDSWCPLWFYSQFASLIAGEHPSPVIGRATPDLPCWNK